MRIIVGSLVLVLLLPALITAFWSFDQLVHLQYDVDKQGWEQDGQPCGFLLWVPPETQYGRWFTKPQSITARNRVAITWLLATPPWMRTDEYARTLVRRFRLLVVLWNLGGLVGIGLITL